MELDKEHRKAREDLFYETNATLGICEVLRQICDEIYEMPNNNKIIELLTEAMIMAKNMNNRLGYYKKTYKDTTGKGGSSLKRSFESTTRRKMRMARRLK